MNLNAIISRGTRSPATTAVCGAVGGLLGGVVLGHVLARHQFDRRIEAEVKAAKDYYIHRLEQQENRHYSEASRILRDAQQLYAPISPADVHEDVELKTRGLRFVDDVLHPDNSENDDSDDDDGVSADEPDIDPLEGYEDDPEERELGEIYLASNESVMANDDVERPEDPDAVGSPPGEESAEHLDELDRDPTIPYVISFEEFSEDGDHPEYAKVTVKYYEGDKVIVDELGVPVRDSAPVVGQDFASHFGDEHVVHVRNDRLQVDYEICRAFGSWVEEGLSYGRPNGLPRVVRREE